MIPNAELIRAVLDGKQVEFRCAGDAEWRTFANPESAISHLATFSAKSFEFRIKPEVKKTWLMLYDGRFINLRDYADAIDTARHYGIKKLYRIEIDATTGDPIGMFVEDVE